MARPQNKVKIKWSPEFAYAIGLLTTDGNLSSNKRHMSLVSNDREQIENFKKCLNINNKIGRHISGTSSRLGFRVQFGDINFYNFLLKIGLTPRKSKTISSVEVPQKYFFDFLRGHFDGDGTFYSYWDPRWKSSFMFYTEFISASKKHIQWLQSKIRQMLKITGHITKAAKNSCYQLKYAKKDSLALLPKIYYKNHSTHLRRKYLKIKQVLVIIGKNNAI